MNRFERNRRAAQLAGCLSRYTFSGALRALGARFSVPEYPQDDPFVLNAAFHLLAPDANGEQAGNGPASILSWRPPPREYHYDERLMWTTTTLSVPMRLGGVEDHFDRLTAYAIRKAVQHEVEEGLFFDGKRVFDPHPEKK